ncbi:MAG: hypothetical protein GXO26_08285 [Crenarchaeota archaeon]|nr:hypothetical protein [Thermoproteota archaeon]
MDKRDIVLNDISERLVSYILANWRRYAYLDNSNCINMPLTRIAKEVVNERVDRATLGQAYSKVRERFRKMGYRVVLKRRWAKNGSTWIEICRD